MKRLWSVFKKVFFGTYARWFIFTYLFVMAAGALFLRLPVSVQSGVELSWVDAFFTAASALSVTGLTTIVVGDVFTTFGLVVLLVIIQFGGIGLIMMVSIFWLVARKKIGFRERGMMMTDQNQPTMQGIVKFIRNVLIVIFTVEAVAFVMMGSYLYLAGYFPLREALFQALFLTISLFTNAGFDIAPQADSFRMFANDYFMQSVGMALIFLGAIGFWTLAEIKEFIVAKLHREKYKFSIFVKMLFFMYVAVWLVGAFLLFLVERNGFLADKGFVEGLYYALFMSLTTRNAGFSTMDIGDFSETTHVLFIAMMFIGASPNSVGGGIRTTTFLVILLALKSFALGRESVSYRERTIKTETVHKSFIAIVMALVLVLVNVFLLSWIEDQPVSALAFEVTSAFGTTGLSLGVTSDPAFHWFSKLLLSILMFVGRMGVLPLLIVFRPDKKTKGFVQYPEMDIIVG